MLPKLPLVARTMILTQILQPNSVRVPLKGTDKNAVISELVHLLDENGLLLNKNVVLGVFSREMTRSTESGPGSGSRQASATRSGIWSWRAGIGASAFEFQTWRQARVDVILLISPLDQTGPHIQRVGGSAADARCFVQEPWSSPSRAEAATV
jgi:hypothetical protein